MNSGGLEC